MSSSRLVTSTSAVAAISSMLSGSTTSSAKSMVDMPRTWSSIGRTATSASLERMTTRAIATRPVSRMASTQQPVGLGPAGPRRQVVGVVVEDRVDVGELDEVLDLDRLGLLGLQRLELAGLDDHVAVGRELEALDDVVVGDLVARRRVDALLRDPHAGLAAELVEAHGLAVDRAVELDGDGDQAEGDRTGPDGARHGVQYPPCARGFLRAQGELRLGARAACPPAGGRPRGGPRRTPRRSWRRTPAGRRGCGWSRGPASTTTSSSTQLAPALRRSFCSEGHEVTVRPRTTPASTRIHGAWQMAPTGFLASKKARTKAMASESMRRKSGLATPPGTTSPS